MSTVNEEFTHRGYFFLPNKESEQVFGTLMFIPNKEIKLELAGSLTNDLGIFGGEERIDFILGYMLDGKKITLYKCHISNRSASFPGYLRNDYTALYLFVGGHFDSEEKLKFSAAYFQFNNLDEWLNISGFKIDDSRFITNKEILINYKLPEKITYQIDSTINYGFEFGFSGPQTNAYQKHIKIEQQTHFYFNFTAQQQALNKILQLSNNFQNFLALATLEVVYPSSIILINNELFQESDNEKIPDKIDLYFVRNKIFNEPKIINRFEMLFSFEIIKESFPKIFKKWLTICDDVEPSINLLFDYIYRSRVFTTNHFLNIIFAVETYHRKRYKNYLIMSDSQKNRLENILSVTPIEHREWLKEKLAFSYEPSLQERLIEIIKSINSPVLLKAIGDIDETITNAKNSRNYYVHFSPRLEKKVLKGGLLFQLTEKLKYILIYCLLRDIGLSETTIDNLFIKNKYRFLDYLNRY